MTANEIIKQIAGLSPTDQEEVIRFVKELENKRKLNGAQLTTLAEELAECDDPARAHDLREKLVEGFYGADKED